MSSPPQLRLSLLTSKPPPARVPGVGILRTPGHLQLQVVELVVLVALEEIRLAVGVGGGRVQVVGDPLPVGDGPRVGRVHCGRFVWVKLPVLVS